MSQIVEPKTYQGRELETIFFRPMLSGPDARELGIKVMYNTPMPTTLNFWRHSDNILRKFSAGWAGGVSPAKFQKTIELFKVKAEMAYTASDYFGLVWEQIATRPDVNFEDLSGTELEEAETELFRISLAESIRATMWLGDRTRSSSQPFNTFDGFITQMVKDKTAATPQIPHLELQSADLDATDSGETILKSVLDNADPRLRELKSGGELAFFVTSDIYAKYEESLDSATLEAAYLARQQGRESLSFRGIPVIDIQVTGYLASLPELPSSVVILTDRRNLALAVNTNDFPGTEVRMWYNPDAMENRQRATFAAGCDYLLPELISWACKM
jgi:hypothetical protein